MRIAFSASNLTGGNCDKKQIREAIDESASGRRINQHVQLNPDGLEKRTPTSSIEHSLMVDKVNEMLDFWGARRR
jgi:hypothetical protein